MAKLSNLEVQLKDKLDELTIIRDLYLKEFELPKSLSDFDEFIELKNYLYQSIRGAVYKNIKFPVTHLKFARENWFETELTYLYSRQGIQPINPLFALYTIEEKFDESKVEGFFTTCCQASNWSVLNAINIAYGLDEITNIKDIFFETHDILKNLRGNNVKTSNKGIGISLNYIDSSSEDYEFPKSVAESEIVIVDTTCIMKTNKELKKFIKESIKNSWKVILTRSHLKLDSLGAEYGLLGSIVLISPDDFPLPNAKKEYDLENIRFQMVLHKTISCHSNFASLELIYPFLSNKKINKLISERENRLQKNYKKIKEAIEESGEEVTFYKNNIFFTFTSNWEAKDQVEFKVKKNKYICLLKSKTNFPIYYTDSFGFDFVSVTAFTEQHRKNKKGITCRVSIGDLNTEMLEQFCKLVPIIIKNLKKL